MALNKPKYSYTTNRCFSIWAEFRFTTIFFLETKAFFYHIGNPHIRTYIHTHTRMYVRPRLVTLVQVSADTEGI